MSTAEFDSKFVIEACDDKLMSITIDRDHQWTKCKENCVRRVNGGIFHRMFRRPNITLEDADRRLREHRDNFFFSVYDEIYRCLYGEQETRVKNIRNLARSADRIRLTDEDYRSVFR